MQFYNVKTRSFVDVPDSKLKKKQYVRKTSKGDQIRFAVRATLDDGTSLTKFVNKEVYENLNVPVEQ
ncbi:MAG: hypothetical protein KatS3mg087_1932 [Patescibacteria group bacterium]|jgi:hypothetical protein|nr:MAG: hypothetical protein KatS3mg087_1932 [Patescibacteria group bacterium]